MCLNYIQIKEIHNNHFTKCGQICDYVHVLAKSKTSREKLNHLTLANDSTPFNRAFFVRNIRTPKEFADFVLSNLKIHSMVERDRQSLTGCLPMLAVSHPVTFYRPTVRSLAVVPENLTLETTQMYQFIFAAIRRTDLTNQIQKIRITADNQHAPRAQFPVVFFFLLTAKINLKTTVKNDRTFSAISRDSMEVAHA